MLTDLLSSDNYRSFNIKVAKILGINAAIYLSEVLNIYNNVLNVNNDKEQYFLIDPKIILDRTTLCEEDQVEIQYRLKTVDILYPKLKESDNDINMFQFNENNYLNLLTTDDDKVIAKVVKFNPKINIQESKRRKQINTVKAAIMCNNSELREALYDWVEECWSTKNGYLSVTKVKRFQQALDQYAKGDLDLALKLIDEAITHNSSDMPWIIKHFETYDKALYLRDHAPIRPAISTKSGIDRKQAVSEEVF